MKTKKVINKNSLFKPLLQFIVSFSFVLITLTCLTEYNVFATGISIDVNSASEGSLGTLELMFLMTLLSLAPSIILMTTSFTRIIIVLSFLRTAMGTQQSPPNQVLIGLALFLSLFIMEPVLDEINETALEPFRTGIITSQEAMENAATPLKHFMIKQTYVTDLNLFLTISGQTINLPDDITEDERNQFFANNLSLNIIVPSFMTSELKRAFIIGFLLYIPFLIIDIVVSSTLMSMGMMMLPPATIAMPFKIVTFILVDGWGLLFSSLIAGFR